jgi:alkanesulfonate monooxygenase SsuD/methylene tetrahydromethanopterin reductase-like flavin-dependent oxidoreductase (luciferase family)
MQLPTVDGFGVGAGDIPATACAVEDAGFDAVWVGDHLTFNAPIIEAFVAATMAVTATRRISVGFGVLVACLRHPAWLAKQLSSLQVVSGNRLALGIGVGGEFAGEWESVGVPREERAARTDAILAVLPELLGGRVAELGDPWNTTVQPLTPAGMLPPLWIGGRGDAALRRAVRNGAGWLGIWQNLATLRERLDRLDEITWENGVERPPVALTVLAHPTDSGSGEPEMRTYMESIYGIPFERVSRYALGGDIPSIVDRLVPLVALGVDELIVIPAVENPAKDIENFAQLRRELLAAL